ncbi:MAG TPA: hypothetical protein VM553_20840 [Dongiaceae bacterium]|nr:hypothetical protein [Dongiaceae bacterium]
MDGEVLKKLAKLKLLVKRTSGQSIEVSAIIADKQYAASVLSAAEESDQEELVLLALELKDALGLLAPAAPAPEPKAPQPAAKEGKTSSNYMFGARG